MGEGYSPCTCTRLKGIARLCQQPAVLQPDRLVKPHHQYMSPSALCFVIATRLRSLWSSDLLGHDRWKSSVMQCQQLHCWHS